jgi:hypothetical protein
VVDGSGFFIGFAMPAYLAERKPPPRAGDFGWPPGMGQRELLVVLKEIEKFGYRSCPRGSRRQLAAAGTLTVGEIDPVVTRAARKVAPLQLTV